MQLHDLKRPTSQKKARQIGRGGRRGKTSGRGHKGQKARAGGSPRPEIRDFIKTIPKLRGHSFVGSPKTVIIPVNLAALDKAFADGEVVSPETLIEKGVVRKRRGKEPFVKILGNGEIKKKVTLERCAVSSSAREKVEKAGGSVR